jgi:hypothetical protein
MREQTGGSPGIHHGEAGADWGPVSQELVVPCSEGLSFPRVLVVPPGLVRHDAGECILRNCSQQKGQERGNPLLVHEGEPLIQSKGLQEGLPRHDAPEEQDSHLGVHWEGPPHHRGWRVTSRIQLHHPLLDRVGPKYLNHVGQDRGADLHQLEGRRLVHIAGTTREDLQG